MPAGHGAVPAAERHPVGTGPARDAGRGSRVGGASERGLLCTRSHELDLLERVSADAVTHVLHGMLEERVERRCRGEYERSFLAEFQEVGERASPGRGRRAADLPALPVPPLPAR